MMKKIILFLYIRSSQGRKQKISVDYDVSRAVVMAVHWYMYSIYFYSKVLILSEVFLKSLFSLKLLYLIGNNFLILDF